jgi:hypothetical protein
MPQIENDRRHQDVSETENSEQADEVANEPFHDLLLGIVFAAADMAAFPPLRPVEASIRAGLAACWRRGRNQA